MNRSLKDWGKGIPKYTQNDVLEGLELHKGEELKEVFNNGYNMFASKINEELDTYNKIQEVLVYANDGSEKVLKVIGNDQSIDTKRLTISDIYASVSYFLNLH